MNDNFDIKGFLKDNTLLKESVEETKVEETVEEVAEAPKNKMKLSELKAKIKENILASLGEADEDEGGVEADIDIDGPEADADISIDKEAPASKGTEQAKLDIIESLDSAIRDLEGVLANEKLAKSLEDIKTAFKKTYSIEDPSEEI